ncbi:hypothetical protein MPSEU_000665200 [Mayamaea pseudoterrestris]|nr:hypothetical protein MPSEU_000665200 [Mayamaea pseudoterrestris]
MAGPSRNKRKRTEAPAGDALERGRGAIGSEPMPKVARTDNTKTNLPVETLGSVTDDPTVPDDKETVLQIQNNLHDGNDHAEAEEPTLSLVEQNIIETGATVPNTRHSEESGATSSINDEGVFSEFISPVRKTSIQDVLDHRKLLLCRLRQAKSSTQKRKMLIFQSQPSKIQETDTQEMAEYHEMARVATAIARKQTKTEVAAPSEQKRNALRRGSGVGKKMNAAISSLMSGSTATETPHSTSASHPVTTIPVAAASVALPGQVMEPSGALADADKYPSAPVPLNSKRTGASQSDKSPLRPASTASGSSRPSMYCPETTNLRDRKKLLERRLSSKILERHQRIQITKKKVEGNLDSLSLSSQLTPSRKGELLSKSLIATAVRGPRLATHLPCRRVTHWDSVLDEMKWLATDFIEEREWKRCASMCLSESLVVERQNAIGRTSSEAAGRPVTAEKPVANLLSTNSISVSCMIDDAVSDDLKSTIYYDETALDCSAGRGVAKVLSGMVVKLASVVPRYPKPVAEYIRNSDSQRNTSDCPSNLALGGASDPTILPSPTTPTAHVGKSAMFEKMSHMVDNITSDVTKSRVKSNLLQLDRLPITLSQAQLETLEAIETQWRTTRCGVQLGGPTSSGKTVLVSTIIGMNKSFGPQLILCNASSMIRWMHEIKRLTDVRIQSVGGSPRSLSREEFNPNDVVVGDFALLSKLSDETLATFYSIVIDLRFPCGYGAAKLRNHANWGGASGQLSTYSGVHPPAELISTRWWTRLANVTCHNRMLIDYPVPCMSHNYINAEVKNRQTAEILALRTMFILGLAELQLPGYSMAKSVLAWARWRVRNLDGVVPNLNRVWTHLSDLLNLLWCNIQNGSGERLEKDWDVRLCALTGVQRVAYDRGCHELRTILSLSTKLVTSESLPQNDSFAPLSEALLHLRRLCVFADISNILDGGCSLSLHGSPSQPDIELAARILTSSAKLKELVLILVAECGVKLPYWDLIAGALYAEVPKASGKIVHRNGADKRRVAVLATLPDAQILTSFLLNVLGIPHTLLLRPPSLPDVEAKDDGVYGFGQATLSHFNSDTKGQRDMIREAYPIVLITSPELVGGDHAGLGVETADLVVLLDDDWSGRGSLLLRSLRSRIFSRQQGSSKLGTCNFIRLVAADTCEASFINSTDELDQYETLNKCEVTRAIAWPTNAAGEYYSPILMPCPVRDGGCLFCKSLASEFGFPATNILKFRNANLSDVLATQIAASQLLTSSELLFVPRFTKKGIDSDTDAALAASLINQEEKVRLRRPTVSNCLKVPRNNALPCEPWKPSFVALSHRNEFKPPSIECLPFVRGTTFDEGVTDVGNIALSLPTALTATDLKASASPYELELTQHEDASIEPVGTPDALLFYPYTDRKTSIRTIASGSRVNAFSLSFSETVMSLTQSFGSAALEVLLYSPPLLPGIQNCAEQARHDVGSMYSRQQLADAGIQASKEHNSFVTEDEAIYGDAASVLNDLADDYGLAGIGAVPLPRDSALLAGWLTTETKKSQPTDAVDIWLSQLPPCDNEEKSSFLAGDYNAVTRDRMLLLVSRKRTRDGEGLSFFASSTIAPGNTSYASGVAKSLQSINTYFQDANGKRLKKKIAPTDARASAFNRLSPTGKPASLVSGDQFAVVSSSMHRPVDHSVRNLSLGRQGGKPRSLFETSSYQAATSRVRNRVADRIERLCWNSPTAFDVGPGLPLIVKQHMSAPARHDLFAVDPALWTSIVKRLRTRECSTGDESLGVAAAQRAAFRRCLNGPCRIDFGPFQCGFLAYPTGMSAILPPRLRPGISLPMGVKIHAPKNLLFDPWKEKEDELLRQSVSRFGMNWVLISKVIGGFAWVSSSFQLTSSVAKSPRACRERWQLLVRAQPKLAKENNEQFARSSTIADAETRRVTAEITTSDRVPSKIEFLVLEKNEAKGMPMDFANEKDAKDTPPIAGSKRSFAAFKAARARKHVVPVTLPGVSGSTPASLPVHPSHVQATQIATANYSSSGRTEMWPLQLLETLDRQRALSTSPPSSSTGAAVSATAKSPSPAVASSRSQGKPSLASSTIRAVAPPNASASHQRPVPPTKPTTTTSLKHSHTSPQRPAATAASFNPPPSTMTTAPASTTCSSSSNATAYKVNLPDTTHQVPLPATPLAKDTPPASTSATTTEAASALDAQVSLSALEPAMSTPLTNEEPPADGKPKP